jgi:quercetin dioxygenase-like cupin family protein
MTYSSSNGVRIERRSFLELSALLAGAARLPRSPAPALEFAAFTGKCEELVKESLAAGPETAEALLLQLAEAGARLEWGRVPRPSLGAFGGYSPKVSFGPVHRAPPVVIIEWKLDPDALLPAHNHTPAYVLSLCLEGECWLQHFEIAGDAPAPGEPGDFRMRKTRAAPASGAGDLITPARDNIPTFARSRGAPRHRPNIFLRAGRLVDDRLPDSPRGSSEAPTLAGPGSRSERRRMGPLSRRDGAPCAHSTEPLRTRSVPGGSARAVSSDVMQATPLSHGEPVRARDSALFHLLETRHPMGMALGRHQHDHACVNFVLEGCYREDFVSSSGAFEPGTCAYKPAGELHSNCFRDAPARCLLVELHDEALISEELDLARLASLARLRPAALPSGASS